MSDLHFPLRIAGTGVISPAGIGSASLLAAARGETVVERDKVSRTLDDSTISTPVYRVPKPTLKTLPKHPRIRRASPITKFIMSAGLAALEDADLSTDGSNLDPDRTGVIVTFMNGCVAYSNRFFGEVLQDPKFASPLLFPETVFNAPGSHLAAFLGITGPFYTLVGDASGILQSINIARLWFAEDIIDRCLILCAEEADWLSAEALEFYGKGLVGTEGGAAFVLDRESGGTQIEAISGPHVFHQSSDRAQCIQATRNGLPTDAVAEATHLVDGARGIPRIDRAENETWADWTGDRISPYQHLGEGMGVGAGFQLAIASQLAKDLPSGNRVLISNPGSNLNAFAASIRS